MRPELLEGYCKTVRHLQQTYRDKIEIHLGLEVEYYPGLLPQLLPVLRDMGIEYLLLGQHFIGDEIGQPYCGAPTGDASVLKRYCRQSMEAMNTGLFTYFAHPDLIKFVGSEALYREQMRLICREAKSCGIPLEINMLGAWAGRNYPDIRFWELAAEEGCSVILGCDAHSPQELNNRKTEESLTNLARELGIALLERTPLQAF